jgi:hypothetical protein
MLKSLDLRFLVVEASLEVTFLLVGEGRYAFSFCFGTLKYPIASVCGVLEFRDALLLCLKNGLSFCGEIRNRLVVYYCSLFFCFLNYHFCLLSESGFDSSYVLLCLSRQVCFDSCYVLLCLGGQVSFDASHMVVCLGCQIRFDSRDVVLCLSHDGISVNLCLHA